MVYKFSKTINSIHIIDYHGPRLWKRQFSQHSDDIDFTVGRYHEHFRDTTRENISSEHGRTEGEFYRVVARERYNETIAIFTKTVIPT